MLQIASIALSSQRESRERIQTSVAFAATHRMQSSSVFLSSDDVLLLITCTRLSIRKIPAIHQRILLLVGAVKETP